MTTCSSIRDCIRRSTEQDNLQHRTLLLSELSQLSAQHTEAMGGLKIMYRTSCPSATLKYRSISRIINISRMTLYRYKYKMRGCALKSYLSSLQLKFKVKVYQNKIIISIQIKHEMSIVLSSLLEQSLKCGIFKILDICRAVATSTVDQVFAKPLFTNLIFFFTYNSLECSNPVITTLLYLARFLLF